MAGDRRERRLPFVQAARSDAAKGRKGKAPDFLQFSLLHSKSESAWMTSSKKENADESAVTIRSLNKGIDRETLSRRPGREAGVQRPTVMMHIGNIFEILGARTQITPITFL
jgi:hypothetical protein